MSKAAARSDAVASLTISTFASSFAFSTQEEADGDISQEVEEYDVTENATEQEKTELADLHEQIDNFNRKFSVSPNPNKVINVPLADPSNNMFGNKFYYGTVKGPRGSTVGVVLTEGFHEYKGTDTRGNPIYSGEGMAHILGERGRKPSSLKMLRLLYTKC